MGIYNTFDICIHTVTMHDIYACFQIGLLYEKCIRDITIDIIIIDIDFIIQIKGIAINVDDFIM